MPRSAAQIRKSTVGLCEANCFPNAKLQLPMLWIGSRFIAAQMIAQIGGMMRCAEVMSELPRFRMVSRSMQRQLVRLVFGALHSEHAKCRQCTETRIKQRSLAASAHSLRSERHVKGVLPRAKGLSSNSPVQQLLGRFRE